MQPSNNGDHRRNDLQSVIQFSDGPTRPRIGCVIVTYMPAGEPLRRQIESIRPQVDHIFLLDNGDGSNLPKFSDEDRLEIILLGENKGIASAQNLGIRRARQCGVDYILLLDQDSLPAADMVDKLLDAIRELTNVGIVVAAVGPQYWDKRQGVPSPFVYRDGWTLKTRQTTPEIRHVPTDFLIASGCLIPVRTFDAVGEMDDVLFIDYVDIEWGLRARRLGYLSFGVPAAYMAHNLGDEWIIFRGRRLPVHSPVRHYYYARNAILLARRTWVELPWKGILLWRLLKQFVLFGVVLPGRTEHFKMMVLGMWHGVINRSGQL